MYLDLHFELLHNLLCNFDARRNHKEEETVSLRVLARFKPHDVRVERVGVAQPPNVTKPDGQECLAGGGQEDGHMTIR